MQTFVATVVGIDDKTVNWTVEEENSKTITDSGLYTALKIQGVYHVTATIIAGPGLRQRPLPLSLSSPIATRSLRPSDVNADLKNPHAATSAAARIAAITQKCDLSHRQTVRSESVCMPNGERGANMRRGLSPCDFCGSVQGLHCYPTDVPGVDCYACADCVALIRNEDWDNLIDRIIAAYAALQLIPEDEQNAFRQELENQLKAFGTFCLQPVYRSRRMALGAEWADH